MKDKFIESILQLVAKNGLSEDNAYFLIKGYQRQTKDFVTPVIDKERQYFKNDIAIIGVACRFPQANTKDEYWSNLVNSYDGIREFPRARFSLVKPFLGENDEGPYVLAGYLDEVDTFDADFFNILPGEAKYMDPQQRLFMQVGYEAIEDAGYGGKLIHNSRVGIYVGYSEARYKELIQSNASAAFVGNFPPVVASRLSYALNLSGPAISVATACSSSLVALHLACEGLLVGDCESALVGGVAISALPAKLETGGLGITSFEGKSRSFDADANGTGWGEGCGVVVIKPLVQAVKDHDNIYAVIKGSAINQDGTSNGIASPNARAQEEVIVQAWKNAGIDPLSISYIETHGTGTKIGDPIEVKGIANAFRRYTKNKQFCGIGSVKSNIGHLDSASGMAGLIKVILALQNKQIPPSLHFERPNPLMNLIDSPVYVNTRLVDWNSQEGTLRRAGVSSFGLSGTNCHIVMEEYKDGRTKETIPGNHWVFTISARSEGSLWQLVEKYLDFLNGGYSFNIGEICYVVNTCRDHHQFRVAIPTSSRSELLEKLQLLYVSRGMRNRGVLESEHIFSSIFKGREEKELELTNIGILTQQAGAMSLTNAIELAEFYAKGGEVFWSNLYPAGGYDKVPLPTYAWNKKSYWVEPQKIYQRTSTVKEIKNNNKVNVTNGDGFPLTEVECKLAIIWGSVLGVNDLDVNDDFFKLGGDSLVATDLVTTINHEFKTQIKLVDFFSKSNIRELAELILKTERIDYTEIIPIAQSKYYPVSSAQRRQYILKQLAGESLSYNMPGVVTITGHLDVERFKETFAKLVQRHESFRTFFDVVEDEIVQIVLPEVQLIVEYCEVVEMDAHKLVDEFIKPFEIGEAPLLRIKLCKFTNELLEDKFLFMFDMHHIISDGVSMEILLKEFVDLYTGQELKPLFIQYKDYAVWHSKLMQSEIMKRQENYWIKTLTKSAGNSSQVLDMPSDYPRPPVMTFEGATYKFTLQKEVVDKLKALGTNKGATLYMTLLAIYNVLLYKYTGQEDIIVGSLTAGRRYAGLEKIIGLFTNYLPIRNFIYDDMRFIDFLENVVQQTVEAYDNQDYPFDKIVEKLGKKRDISRNPIFDTMLILHNQGMQNTRIDLNGLTLETFDWDRRSTTLDFKLDVFQGMNGELNCSIEYYTRLFNHESIEKLSLHFVHLLQEITAKPERKISEYQIFTKDELETIEKKKRIKKGEFALPAICLSPKAGSYPLSFYQKSIWANKDKLNNFVVHVELYGQLNQDILLKTLNEIQAGDVSFRVTFKDEASSPSQQVQKHILLDYSYIKLIDGFTSNELTELIAIEYNHRFNLIKGPLYRVRLLHCDEEKYHLILTFHPLIIECLNINDFLRRLSVYYKKFLQINSRQSDCIDCFNLSSDDSCCSGSVSVIDFGQWHHKLLKQGYLEPQKAFWEDNFKKPIPHMELPIKHSAGTSGDFIWGLIHFELLKEESIRLDRFAEMNHVNVTEILLTCYIMLLQQLTQMKDVLVGVIHPDETYIHGSGMPIRVNYPIPIRINMEEISSFNNLIKVVSKKYREGANNMLYPFSLIQEKTALINQNGNFSIYDVLFSDEDCEIVLPDCCITDIHFYRPEKVLLKFSVIKKGNMSKFSFMWNKALLEPQFVNSLSERYKKIIKTITKNINL